MSVASSLQRAPDVRSRIQSGCSYQPVGLAVDGYRDATAGRASEFDLAVRRELRPALIAGAFIAVLATILFRLFGGGL